MQLWLQELYKRITKALSQIDCTNSSHCFNVATIIPDVLSIGSTTGERKVEMINQWQMNKIYLQSSDAR